ncbi:MAG: M1 family peptidase, partial [Acidobacteriota bacterium]
MKNWKTMVGLALLAGVFLLAGPVPAADDVRLGRKVVPVFQAINLKLDAEKSDYTGSVEIRLDVKEPIRVFRLHAQGQQLQSVDLQGEQGTIRASHHVNEKGVLSISTEELLEPGSYRLNIRFQNLFNARAVGLYRMENSGTGYVFSQFEATDARRAFPCFDEPIFKIPYQITLNIPKGQVAVTNTPLESTAVSGGWTTLTFRKTRPLPSYLLAMAEGPLESVAIPGLSVPGRIYTVAGQAHLTEVAAGMTPRILAALEKFFGRPYPYAKLDLLAIPEYWPGAMEN